MKICPNCGTQLSADAAFCGVCGRSMQHNGQPTQLGQQNTQSGGGQNYDSRNQYAPAYDPYDHTGEFTVKDISENKVFAMLGYLFGIFGVIVALLAASAGKSEFVMFHIRQALKFSVLSFLVTIANLLLFWTLIIPFAGVIFSIVMFVVKLISFFQVCSGKAKEPVILRSIPFLK